MENIINKLNEFIANYAALKEAYAAKNYNVYYFSGVITGLEIAKKLLENAMAEEEAGA